MSAPVLDDPAPFDLAGPLPSGTVVLEASAGTGKTYTIAGLATRWVAETDARLPNLLIVTFTRAATAELRDRVRARLVEAADHLEAVLARSRCRRPSSTPPLPWSPDRIEAAQAPDGLCPQGPLALETSEALSRLTSS